MNKHYLLAIAATLITFLLAGLAPTTTTAASVDQKLLLLYSNDVHGETEVCG